MMEKIDRRKMSPVQKAWEAMTAVATATPGTRVEVRPAPDRGKEWVRVAVVVVDTGETHKETEPVKIRWVTLYSWASKARPQIRPRVAWHLAKRMIDTSPWRIPFVRLAPNKKNPQRQTWEAVAGLPWPPPVGRGKEDPVKMAEKKLARARTLMEEGLAELDRIPKPVRILR